MPKQKKKSPTKHTYKKGMYDPYSEKYKVNYNAGSWSVSPVDAVVDTKGSVLTK